MDAWGRLLLEVRRRHLGVLHLDDGALVDLAEGRIRRRASNEAWPAPYPCVYLLPGIEPSKAALAYAAVRSIGEPVAVADRTARALHGLGPWPRRPELLLPHGRRWRPGPDVDVVRSRRMVGDDVIRVGPVPVTSVARTALGLAARWRQELPVRNFLVDALQQRKTTMAELVALLQRVRGVTGRPILDRVVSGLVADSVDSRLEDDARSLLQNLGFDVAPHPFPLLCRDGRVVHLDIAIPDLWHAIECDGAGAHMDRRSFETDRVRWSEIQRSGVTLTWLTRARIESDRDRVAAEIAEATRGADGRPPMQPAHDCVAVGCRRGLGAVGVARQA